MEVTNTQTELSKSSSNENNNNNANEYQGLSHNQEQNLKTNLSNKTGLENAATHDLNSTWCFWYASRKMKDHSIPYSDRLKKFAEFSTVEDFFKYYVYLKSASEIDRNTDISMFKINYQPLWESCPNSGCLFIRFKKNDDPIELDLNWEKLLFSMIGEQFDESTILGTTLSIRGRETIIELWFDYNKNEKVKTALGHKIKSILNLDKNIMIYFKDNSLSLQDKSTLKNAETYNFSKRKNTYF
jgi:translation initiation factor 4E